MRRGTRKPMDTKPLTAAIYARVSTKPRSECLTCGKTVRVNSNVFMKHRNRQDRPCLGSGKEVPGVADKGQDVENQLIQLREYCNRQNWKILEYMDQQTGKHGERDAFKQLFEDASRRKFDVVVVWALDRFTREGVYETFDYVRKLTLNGVQFESYTEAHFRTTGPAGELMLAVAAWIAKQERLRISERTKVGMERASSAGIHCGRPRRVFRIDQAKKMHADGFSLRQIAAALDVSFMTVKRAVTKA